MSHIDIAGSVMTDHPTLVTKTELGRILGADPRSLRKEKLRILAYLQANNKRIPLYGFPMDSLYSALVVNSNPPMTHAK
jgi:hypothetical protein